MSVNVELVAVGHDARAALLDAILEAKANDLFTPVTVLAPTMRAATQLRHDMARQAVQNGRLGLANVRFTVMARLAELMGGPALRQFGRRRLDRNSLGAAVRATLQTHRGFLSNVIDHASTESEIAHFYEEIRYLSDTNRIKLASVGPREHELVGIIDTVRHRLFRTTYDDVDLFESASTAARDQNTRGSFGTVIVHLPQRMRSTEASFVAALAERGDIAAHIGRTESTATERVATQIVTDLYVALRDANVDVDIGAIVVERRGVAMPFDRSVIAPDQTGEVREAVALVRDQLSQSLRPDRIGIAYPKAVPYLRVLQSELDAAGITWNGPSGDVLRAAPPCQFLLALLHIATGDLTRNALMDLVEAAVVRDVKGNPVAVHEWERCSRLTGVVAGDDRHWRTRLDALATESRAERRRLTATLSGGSASIGGSTQRRAHQADRTIAACTELDHFLGELFSFVTEFHQASTCSTFVRVATKVLDQFLGPQQWRAEQGGLLGEQDKSLMVVLGELALTDDVGEAISLGQFTAALDVALSRPGPSNGRSGLGVFVGDVGSFVALDLDLLLVLGCSEGDLPGAEMPSPLLSAKSRELVGLEVQSKSSIVERDEMQLSVALAGAKEKIAISPAVDAARARRRLVSRFVDPQLQPERTDSYPSLLRAMASGQRPAPNLTELFAADLFAARQRGESFSDHVLLHVIDPLDHAIHAVLSRDRYGFDRFSGYVAHADLGESLFADSFSPTTLESYATCPFRYYVAHELSCEVIRVPEQGFYIDARLRGTIAHEILERFYGEQLEAVDNEVPSDALPLQDLGSIERLIVIAEEVISHTERLGLTGRHALWEPDRRRLVRDLVTERALDLERRATDDFRPVAVEHTFGSRDQLTPVSVQISSGPLRFRGKIDRIDASPTGAVRVLDYKTGQSKSFRKLQDDPVDRGRHLQLPVYAEAARNDFPTAATLHVEASFRFVGRDEDVSYVLNDRNSDRFVSVLDTMVQSIRSGLFPAHPGPPTAFESLENCRWCDFDSLCLPDRSRRWTALREDARLRPYVELSESDFASEEVST